MNTTWVTLVPKKQGNALGVNEFRPISMVGSIYKVIAKILSKRLQVILPRLVSDSQTAFIKGRQILDGALIANEVVGWLKKTKRSGALLKLDFEKAYDSVDRTSIDSVLKEMGFGMRWRQWIMHALQHPTFLY